MIKNNIIRIIHCLIFIALAFCSSSWAADTKRTTKNDQLPSPVVTLVEPVDAIKPALVGGGTYRHVLPRVQISPPVPDVLSNASGNGGHG
jgi:hypothetical protein